MEHMALRFESSEEDIDTRRMAKSFATGERYLLLLPKDIFCQCQKKDVSLQHQYDRL